MKIAGSSIFTAGQGISLLGKQENTQKQNIVNDPAPAAQAEISRQGQEMSAAMRKLENADSIGAATDELNDIKADNRQNREQKQRIREIEENLESSLLTDDDRAVLEKEKAELEAKSMTAEDKLYSMYEAKRAALRAEEAGTGLHISYEKIAFYDEGIAAAKQAIKEDAEHVQELEQTALQEKATAYAEAAKEDAAQTEEAAQAEKTDNAVIVQNLQQLTQEAKKSDSEALSVLGAQQSKMHE